MDVLFYIFRRTKISIKKETLVNLLSDPQEERLTYRSTDVLVHGWIGGKNICMNLIEISLFVGLGTEDFTLGQTTVKVALTSAQPKKRIVSQLYNILKTLHQH
jgi:hypothetical protein